MRMNGTILMLGLVLGVLCHFSSAWSGPKDAGLYSVSSVYNDELTGQNVRIHGVGALIQARSRFYLLTNAHVTGGAQGLEIDLNGEHPKVLRRWSDAILDVEWLEVEKPANAQPFAIFSAACACFATREQVLGKWRNSVVETGWGFFLPILPDDPEVARQLTAFIWNNSSTYVQATPWGNSTPALLPLSGGERILSKTRIAAGLSGTPLLKQGLIKLDSGDYVGGYKIHGIAASMDRDYETSYFIPAEALWKSFQRPPRSDAARFRLRGGLLYLDYGNGISEVNPLQLFAGGGETTDGGKSGKRAKVAPANPYQEYRIRPGLLWKGRPAIALRIPGIGRAPVFGNRAAIDRVLALGLEELVQPVEPGARLTDFLLKKISSNPEGMKIVAPEAVSQSRGGKVHGESSLRFLSNGRVRIEIPFEQPEKETLVLDLDEFGRVLDQKGVPLSPIFLPRIQVVGPESGKDYSIDLSFFYFENLSDIPESSLPLLKFTGPILRVLRKDLGRESVLEFEFPLPITPEAGAAP